MRTLPQSKDEGAGARTFQGEGSFSKMVKVEKSGASEKLVNNSKKKKEGGGEEGEEEQTKRAQVIFLICRAGTCTMSPLRNPMMEVLLLSFSSHRRGN